jgi:hypothetical protein
MLEIQSGQLAGQRKVNAEQIRVLALRAAELRESLEERKREAVERRNAQASQVWIAVKVAGKGRAGSWTSRQSWSTLASGSSRCSREAGTVCGLVLRRLAVMV